MNYDEMKAGDELDSIIAELFFGWKWIRFKYELGGAEGPEDAFQVPPDDFPGFFDEYHYMPDDGKYPRSYRRAERPRFSREIAAAWQVVERLAKIPSKFDDSGRTTNGQFGAWFNDACLFALTAEEAAHEICKAALKAVAA